MITQNQTEIQVSSKAVFKRFLIIFVPLLIITAGIVLLIYYTQASSERAITESREQRTVELQTQIIAANFETIVSDLMFLSEQQELHAMLADATNGPTKAALLAEYLSMSGRKGLYDQIRFLDDTGMEITRVNYNQGEPVIVPDEKLQNKGDRYYFADAFQLDRGQVFVSPLDLNIEGGQIEQPLKPMIRFGTPVFDQDGQKRGIVLLNYFGADLLQNLEEAAANATGDVMLLNSEGFWLKGPNPEAEWGFMYDDGGDRTFEKAFPAAWQTLSKSESGQFYDENGMFTFATVYPLQEGFKSSTGSGKAFEASEAQLGADEYYWKVVSHVPPAVLNARTDQLSRAFALLFAALIVPMGVGAWFLARAGVIRQQSDLALKNYAIRLEQSNRELEDFAYVASHDLQEPLRKVQAFGDRLKEKYGDALDERGRDYIVVMQNAALRMQTLINGLLTYSRVTTQAQPFEPVNLNQVAQEVVSDLETRIEQVGGKVEIKDLPTVEADPLQMRQLLQNLIGNGLKFHRDDAPPLIKVWAKPVQSDGNGHISSVEMYQVMIEDNGIGFEEQYRERVFQVFQRLHGRDEYEGTGIGLATCRKIVERHGGVITANSTPGQGSTFIFTVPAKHTNGKH
jgi:signal transduction histidine kinase